MKNTKRLFRQKDIYDIEPSNEIFAGAIKENALFHYKNCPAYKRILDGFGFDPESIHTYADVKKLPFIPTLYFKHHHLQSVAPKKQIIKATSSGTSGSMSKIGFDFKSLNLGKKMVIRVGRYHKLWSIKPVNYIIFGYRPTRENKTAVSKTALGFTFFAPALSRTFPAYTYFLLRDLKEKGIRYQMPKGSMVTLGGGWKQFYAEKVDKRAFYSLVKEVLGIEETNVIEFFGAVEHPILYTDCRRHHFHIPVYSRVIIRDPDDFSPLPNGQPGIINLLSPMMQSAPLCSIVTDDLGVLHTEPCPCGAKSPWLEIIGRVGISDIVTCAAGADEYLKE